jgi:hypothetical protein
VHCAAERSPAQDRLQPDRGQSNGWKSRRAGSTLPPSWAGPGVDLGKCWVERTKVLIREMLDDIGLLGVYQKFHARGIKADLQGWEDYDHPYFEALIERTKPRQIVEIGSWKGRSAVIMARNALSFHADAIVLCVDTWLGSNEILWRDPEFRKLLRLKNGYPNLYPQFLANIISEKLTKTIFPLPMTSTSAAELLSAYEIVADLIYVDAGHQEHEVYTDLVTLWPLLRKDGILWGDDYNPGWPGVVRAVTRFAYENALYLETSGYKFCLTK